MLPGSAVPVKVGVALVVPLAVGEVITGAPGAVVSSVQSRVAGEGSATPLLTARTAR